MARQLHTDSGFPDLVGIDEDGRLVLLELKRGILTRDAVAQILDYASDFRERDPDDLSRLIEDSSGKAGIDEIEDFQDWHSREYPDKSEALEQNPRLVLVGLGADERAKRIVNFLAESGIDIRLLTFHAVTLWVERKMPGRLALTLSPRVLDIAEDEAESFVQEGPGEKTQKISTPVRAEFNEDNWGEVQPHLERLLQRIVEGLRDKIAAAEAEEESSQHNPVSEDSG